MFLWSKEPRVVLAVVVTVGVFKLPGAASAAPSYSLQLGAYTTPIEAQVVLHQYSLTCSPVTVEQVKDGTGFPYKVRGGKFSSYAEAWVHKSALPGDFAPGNFIVQSGADLGSEANKFPVKMPFNTSNLAKSDGADADNYWKAGGWRVPKPSEQLLKADPASLSRDAMHSVGIYAPNDARALPALERFVQQFENTPQIHQARLCLARVLGRGADFSRAETLLTAVTNSGSTYERAMGRFLRAHLENNRRQDEKALNEFIALANDSGLPQSMRRESMLRAAAIAHRRQDYPLAWLAFSQIEATAADPASAANARVELAGLAFELVERSKGSWSEVRNLCDSVHFIQGAPRQSLATASLMRLETLFNEGRFDACLDAVDAFCEQYQDVPRELYLARLWEGLTLVELGGYDAARVSLDAVTILPIQEEEKFAGVDPRARAAIWLVWIANRQGDAAAREQWADYLALHFPNSQERQRAFELFGL